MNIPLHLEHWEETLFQLGFSRAGDSYRRDDWRLKAQDRWVWLEHQPHAATGDALSRELGTPGLWKWVQRGDAQRRVFDLLADIFWQEDEADSNDGRNPVPTLLEQCLVWAQTTANGNVPRDWRHPQPHLLESWLPRKRLTLRVGREVHQGELLCSEERLAIRFPIRLTLPEDLPESRLHWLDALLRDAQDRTHMVRLGLDRTPENASVLLECDLTGAPQGACELLMSAGLDGLEQVVRWLAESVECLADAGIDSQVLALCAVHEPTPNRKEQV